VFSWERYLKFDEADDNQNCAPEARTQQYSGNCPTRGTVTALGSLYALRTIIAQRDSSVFADACRNDWTVHIEILVILIN